MTQEQLLLGVTAENVGEIRKTKINGGPKIVLIFVSITLSLITLTKTHTNFYRTNDRGLSAWNPFLWE